MKGLHSKGGRCHLNRRECDQMTRKLDQDRASHHCQRRHEAERYSPPDQLWLTIQHGKYVSVDMLIP
jgi:hypothetical protein